MTEETVNNSEKQQVVGVPFTKDDPRINKDGRPIETPEQKIIKKATKQLIAEYKDKLAEALPLIEPKLIEKAVAGDIQFIKELHDRVMGKAEQPLGNADGKPFVITIAKEIAEQNDITPPSTSDNSEGQTPV